MLGPWLAAQCSGQLNMMELHLIVSDNVAFFTPEEMAAKLRISLRKFQQMLKDGTAPKHIRLGTKVLFAVTKEGANG